MGHPYHTTPPSRPPIFSHLPDFVLIFRRRTHLRLVCTHCNRSARLPLDTRPDSRHLLEFIAHATLHQEGEAWKEHLRKTRPPRTS